MEQGPSFRDLDNAVLVNIFGRLDPLPNLFSLSRVCRRFRKLASDGRLWLRVSGTALLHKSAPGHRSLAHGSLAEAVMASRPGDTILLEPGVSHAVQDVAVNWPLRLLGGGKTAEETLLICTFGANSAVDFRASGIIANLTVCSEQSACVIHHRGRLVVESCMLHSTPAPGLEHLFTPLVTLASSPARRTAKQSRGGEQHWQPSTAPEGVLSVKETKIRGGAGMRAVQTRGTGIVAGVRVINFSNDTLFWFEVDSAQHRTAQQLPTSGSSSPTRQIAVKEERDQSELPGWAVAGKPLFPVLLQPGAAASLCTKEELAGSPCVKEEPANLRSKSRAWQRAHLMQDEARNVKPRCEAQ